MGRSGLLLLLLACLAGCREAATATQADYLGRWTVGQDLGLSGLVTGLDIFEQEGRLRAHVYLSGRVREAAAELTTAGLTIVTDQPARITVDARLREGVLHAQIRAGEPERRINTTFVRSADARR